MTTDLRLSVQLYSLRHIADVAEQLRLVQANGLRFVETTSGNYDELDAVAAGLRAFGLTAPSGHVGIDRLRGDFAATVAAARRLGTELLVLWGFPDDQRHSGETAWQRAGEELGELATRLRREGLRFAFHNHDWELEAFDGGLIALDRLFAGAGGAPLLWQADLAWIARGQVAVEPILRRHGGRLVSVHVKDLAPPGSEADEDGWADLGHGVLPWREWWPTLRGLGVDLMVLEHDEPRDPARFLRRSAAHARDLA